MSYINETLLVGEIVKAPEQKTSRQDAPYVVLMMRTGKVVPIGNGKTKWVFAWHRVVVFRQDRITRIKDLKVGDWITVRGELSYYKKPGKEEVITQIVVEEGEGDARPMFKQFWHRLEGMTDEEYDLIVKDGVAAPSEAATKSEPIAKKVTKTEEKPKEEDIDDQIPF
jgi:single-stranded DNA-binding protein